MSGLPTPEMTVHDAALHLDRNAGSDQLTIWTGIYILGCSNRDAVPLDRGGFAERMTREIVASWGPVSAAGAVDGGRRDHRDDL